MKRRTHLALSVEGALRAKDRELRCFTNDDGQDMTPKEVREHLKLAKFEGKKYIPLSPCDNFDFQTGCKGHDLPDEEETLNH